MAEHKSKQVKAIGFINTERVSVSAKDITDHLQMEVIGKEAERLGVKIVGWFVQTDYAGAITQPGMLDRALSYCQANKGIKYLIVTEKSCICPSIQLLHFWEMSFAKAGVDIKAVDEEELLRWTFASLAEAVSLEFADYMHKKQLKADKAALRREKNLGTNLTEQQEN